ncbi:MAG: CBS domain-containing protein [Myxococcales bacterium]
MKIGELCNRTVYVAERMDSAADVARVMREQHVGSVVIVDRRQDRTTPVGIITDRDLTLTVVAENRPATATPIARLMSDDLYSAREDEDVFEVLQHMRAHGVRRVPVVDAADRLLGIFSFDDMVEWTSAQLAELTQLVQRERSRERE